MGEFFHTGSNGALNDINFDGVVGLVVRIAHHGAPKTPIGVGLCAYICQKIGYGVGGSAGIECHANDAMGRGDADGAHCASFSCMASEWVIVLACAIVACTGQYLGKSSTA